MDATDFVQITRREKFSEEEFYPMIISMYERVWSNLPPPQLDNRILPTKVGKNIVTPADTPIPDCLPCGACCGSMMCIAVGASEKQLSAENYWDIVRTGANGEFIVDQYLRRNGETFACAALEGEIGNEVKCGIYEQRPSICHVFEAGSDKCHALRRAYGIEPALTVEEIYEAEQKLKAKNAGKVPSEVIQDTRIDEKPGTNLLEILGIMKDGSLKLIHAYDPNLQTWRQYQFCGLTIEQAKDLISSRTQKEQNL